MTSVLCHGLKGPSGRSAAVVWHFEPLQIIVCLYDTSPTSCNLQGNILAVLCAPSSEPLSQECVRFRLCDRDERTAGGDTRSMRTSATAERSKWCWHHHPLHHVGAVKTIPVNYGYLATFDRYDVHDLGRRYRSLL